MAVEEVEDMEDSCTSQIAESEDKQISQNAPSNILTGNWR